MSPKILISAVLGTYNRLKFLKLTIDSIRKELEDIQHEIIVVDGGSTDGTLKWLFKQKDIISIIQNYKGARFDSRVFTIPSPTDVINYLIWRQQDATRNSISAVAQSLYSHSQLNGKSGNEQQEMIFQMKKRLINYLIIFHLIL